MNVTEYIQPINMNGLEGRYLHLPAPKKKHREILLLYGHHSSIERMAGIAEDLNQYGSVIMPDFPGFGGMDSFYKIKMKPTLDNLADYLAAFIKLHYKDKKITIIGMSLGFVVATRMLQNYPMLIKKVDLLISVVGFCHRDDYTFSKSRYTFYLYTAKLFRKKIPAFFFKNVILHPAVLRIAYSKTHNAKNKFKGLSPTGAKKAMDFEIHLWRCNDVRTYMDTTISMLTLDNCGKHIAIKVDHISVESDQYFDNQVIEQHMRVIFTDYKDHRAVMDNHAPSIIADKNAAK